MRSRGFGITIQKLVGNSLVSVCLCVRHPLVLQELSRLLAGRPFRPLACRFDPAGGTSREHLRIPRASVYVVDSPSRKGDATRLASEVLTRYPSARVLVIVERLDEGTSSAFLRMGAKGLLRYSEIEGQFVRALETLAAGDSWVPRIFLSRFIEKTLWGRWKRGVRPAHASLSGREKEVLELLLENLSNKEIASRLHISSRTAKFHVSNILAKYGVQKRGDLLLMRSA